MLCVRVHTLLPCTHMIWMPFTPHKTLFTPRGVIGYLKEGVVTLVGFKTMYQHAQLYSLKNTGLQHIKLL